jgi:hypothetical protein
MTPIKRKGVMGLRDLVLYGRDKEFGIWFHQQCVYAQNNATVASNRFKNNKLVTGIDGRNARRLNELIGNYVSALFVTYLVFAISEDQGEDYLVKHLTPIAAVVRTVFGPHTLELYKQVIDYVSSRRVTPESAVTHLLVDPLEVPLGHESAVLENAFDFFEQSLKENWIPTLEETYSHNPDALRKLLETFGHHLGR